MQIPHTKIEKSSQIASVGYDAPSKLLEVRFHTGGLYRYSNVPPEKHAAMLKAPSAGKYLHAEIKGKHPHLKVDEAAVKA